MTKKEIADGVAHKMPTDLQKAFMSVPAAKTAWKDITPLARNEWICWILSAKKTDTRSRRIKMALTELARGKRRPCCWAGCNHRASLSLR